MIEGLKELTNEAIAGGFARMQAAHRLHSAITQVISTSVEYAETEEMKEKRLKAANLCQC